MYSNDFATDEQAQETLLANLPSVALAEPRQLRFVTGKRKQAWNKNCLAVGLASGFMEPLESTSIHLVQSMIMRFLALFPRRTGFEAERKRFNQLTDTEIHSIRDFLILHYKATKRDDSELWNYCRNMDIPDSLSDKIELYRSGSRLDRDSQELFGQDSWLAVLEGQHMNATSYSPLVDSMPIQALDKMLRDTREVVGQCVTAMPSHEDFIRQTLCRESG